MKLFCFANKILSRLPLKKDTADRVVRAKEWENTESMLHITENMCRQRRREIQAKMESHRVSADRSRVILDNFWNETTA